MTATFIPKRDNIAHHVELYACLLLALRVVLVDAQLRLLRWFLLMMALGAKWSMRQCDDTRLRRCGDTTALAAGAVLPLALQTVHVESALVAAAGAAATLTLALRQRVHLGANATVGFALGAYSWWRGLDSLSSAIIGAVPVMQVVLISNLEGVFTGGEAALAASAIGAALLRGAHKASSVEEALVNISLLGACCMVAVVLDAAAAPGSVKRRLLVTSGLLAPCYGAAWRVWQAEPIWSTLRWACNSTLRRALLGAWSAATLTMVVTICPNGAPGEHHLARKHYHALAAAIFVSGAAVDSALTRVASAAALALFVGCEALRADARSGAPHDGKGGWLLRVGAQLLDERDGGAVAVSHVYLLLACAAPVLVVADGDAARLGGVVAVCALDTAAALVGRRFGRMSLAHARTLEGAVGGALAALLAALALRFERSSRLLVACAFTAVVETCTSQLDNLVLPLAFLAAYGRAL